MHAWLNIDPLFLQWQTERICRSYSHWTGRTLVQADDAESAVGLLMEAAFAVLSHDTRSEPLFNYANLAAQRLFKMDWVTFTQMPSRFSAEPMLQAEREDFLQRVTQHGYIDDYSGIRIASDGSKFLIEQATVWNIVDEHGGYYGQAAMIPGWQPL
jgi:hypothetical protein